MRIYNKITLLHISNSNSVVVIIDFKNSMSVIIHLGMSGRLKIIKINMPVKNHDHLVFKFNNADIEIGPLAEKNQIYLN